MCHYNDTCREKQPEKEKTMKKITKIRREIQNLKSEISEIGDMRPGSLTKQSRSWGKSYWQLSYTHRGKGGTGYVSEKRYEVVKEQVDNYRYFKEKCLELVDLSIKLAKLEDKELSS